MEDLILGITRSLVEHPDQIEIKKREEGDTLFFELSVAKDDLGKIIGKQGRTVRAMRTLLAVRAAREKKSCRLEIAE